MVSIHPETLKQLDVIDPYIINSIQCDDHAQTCIYIYIYLYKPFAEGILKHISVIYSHTVVIWKSNATMIIYIN